MSLSPVLQAYPVRLSSIESGIRVRQQRSGDKESPLKMPDLGLIGNTLLVRQKQNSSPKSHISFDEI